METQLSEPRYAILAAIIKHGTEISAGDLAVQLGEQKAATYFHMKKLAEDGVLINRNGKFCAKKDITIEKFTQGRSSPSAPGQKKSPAGGKKTIANLDRAIDEFMDALASVRGLILTPAEMEEYEALKKTRDALAAQGFKFRK